MAAPLGTWTTALIAASIIFAGMAGYKAGQLSASSQHPPQLRDSKSRDEQNTPGEAVSQEEEDEEDEETRADGDLGSVSTHGPCKMVGFASSHSN